MEQTKVFQVRNIASVFSLKIKKLSFAVLRSIRHFLRVLG